VPESICEPIRNHAIPIINRIFHNNSKQNPHNKFLSSILSFTKTFTKEHPEIFFTKADKGNTTVILNKKDYLNKMTDMLSDSHTYEIIHQDPTNNLTQKLRQLLTRWKNNGYIDISTYRKLLTTDGSLPRAYGLPKIHKQGYPLRIIVSSIGSPLYALSNFLHNTIKNSISTPNSFIKNSYHLVSKLSGITLDAQLQFAFLDVVFLFTNVPSEWYMRVSKKDGKRFQRTLLFPSRGATTS